MPQPRRLLLFYLLTAMTIALPAAADPLQAYTWENRLLLIFTPTPDDPGYLRQQRDLDQARPGLAERDLVVLRLQPGAEARVDGRAAGFMSAPIYRDYAIDPARFAVVLVGKDGSPKLIRDAAVSSQTLFDLIDSMPMRQWEMQNPDA